MPFCRANAGGIPIWTDPVLTSDKCIVRHKPASLVERYAQFYCGRANDYCNGRICLYCREVCFKETNLLEGYEKRIRTEFIKIDFGFNVIVDVSETTLYVFDRTDVEVIFEPVSLKVLIAVSSVESAETSPSE